MEYSTKFSIEDHAWYMKNNKPIEVIISAIVIFDVNSNQSHIKYNAKNVIDSVSWLDHENLFENILFKSKAELLKSLFGSYTECRGKNCNAINGEGHSSECIKEHEQYATREAPEMPGFEGTREALQKLGKNKPA